MFLPAHLLDAAARWRKLKRWERRELGQELRRLGLSYNEIRQVIPVPKGTLSGWCRDISPTEEQLERLRSMSGNSEAARAKTGALLHARNLERVSAIRAAAQRQGT